MGNIYRVLARKKIHPRPAFFSTRVVVEDCENIHLHFRSLRIELSVREFVQLVGVMNNALQKFRNWGQPVKIPIDKIEPHNDSHPEGFEKSDDDHREGIEKVKQMIKSGKNILPVLLKDFGGERYLREDGFKRYFAFKELGYKEIDCFVGKNTKPGGQEGMSWVVEKSENTDGLGR